MVNSFFNFAFSIISMPKINFFTEDISYNLKGKNAVKAWIKETIAQEGYKLNELNFIFCSDEYLLRVNQDFLQHDYYTDRKSVV